MKCSLDQFFIKMELVTLIEIRPQHSTIMVSFWIYVSENLQLLQQFFLYRFHIPGGIKSLLPEPSILPSHGSNLE